MTRPHSSRAYFAAASLLVLGLGLAGCAATPAKITTPAASPVPAPIAPGATMAPIPNPPEHETVHAPRPPAATSPEAPGHRPSVGKTPPATKAPAANPTRAAALRAAGLEQLNRGDIDKAVALLQRAGELDPDNVLIKRDLERAIRIRNAVGAKH
jgi:hypothetical protein